MRSAEFGYILGIMTALILLTACDDSSSGPPQAYSIENATLDRQMAHPGGYVGLSFELVPLQQQPTNNIVFDVILRPEDGTPDLLLARIPVATLGGEEATQIATQIGRGQATTIVHQGTEQGRRASVTGRYLLPKLPVKVYQPILTAGGPSLIYMGAKLSITEANAPDLEIYEANMGNNAFSISPHGAMVSPSNNRNPELMANVSVVNTGLAIPDEDFPVYIDGRLDCGSGWHDLDGAVDDPDTGAAIEVGAVGLNGPLAEGEASSLVAHFILPESVYDELDLLTEDKLCTIELISDSTNKVRESNEENNRRSLIVQFLAAPGVSADSSARATRASGPWFTLFDIATQQGSVPATGKFGDSTINLSYSFVPSKLEYQLGDESTPRAVKYQSHFQVDLNWDAVYQKSLHVFDWDTSIGDCGDSWYDICIREHIFSWDINFDLDWEATWRLYEYNANALYDADAVDGTEGECDPAVNATTLDYNFFDVVKFTPVSIDTCSDTAVSFGETSANAYVYAGKVDLTNYRYKVSKSLAKKNFIIAGVPVTAEWGVSGYVGIHGQWNQASVASPESHTLRADFGPKIDLTTGPKVGIGFDLDPLTEASAGLKASLTLLSAKIGFGPTVSLTGQGSTIGATVPWSMKTLNGWFGVYAKAGAFGVDWDVQYKLAQWLSPFQTWTGDLGSSSTIENGSPPIVPWGSWADSCSLTSVDSQQLCASCRDTSGSYVSSCKQCQMEGFENLDGQLSCITAAGSWSQTCNFVSFDGTSLCAQCMDATGVEKGTTCATCSSLAWGNGNGQLFCE